MATQIILASDSFVRANNSDLGTAWDVQTGDSSWKISSNTAVPISAGTDSSENYNGVTWPDDQWGKLAITTNGGAASTRGPGIGLRMSTSAKTWYRILFNENPIVNVRKFVATVSTGITTFTPSAYVAGADLNVGAIGTELIIIYNNILLGTVTDASIASGRVGINFSSSTTASSGIDWAGGTYIDDEIRRQRMMRGLGR